MTKFSYFLLATVFCSVLAVEPVSARESGWNSGHGQSGVTQFRDKGNHWSQQSDRGAKPDRRAGKKKDDSRQSQYKNWGSNEDHDRKKGQSHKPGHSARYATPAPRYHGVPPRQPVYRAPYYKPHYVYVKPRHTPRYYGYYPYRGFFWPFAHVNFVINLSNTQIERHHQAVFIALDGPVGQITSWSENGRYGTIVVLRDGFDEYGYICKQYRQTIRYHGRVSTEVSISCLSPEGYWETP
ncbi:hypothetical protein [Sneathiella sp.]|uniref:hypothetical protein n=1 Tax=Sneathiella sp. TaxID=1964365 RepID=UPI003567AB82